jgi:DNA-binding HxlR family transcriptional regulator
VHRIRQVEIALRLDVSGDRLRKLAAYGNITTKPDPSDGRKVTYLLTKKGIDLAPRAHGDGALGSRPRRHRQSGAGKANARG